MLSYDAFLRDLRYALNHLYEPEILRFSPLQNILLPENPGRARIPLGTYLINAIEALKPPLTTPRDAHAWRVYELLYYRYVQGANQADLAKQFLCSVREIRRQQSHALAVLAESLLAQVEPGRMQEPVAPPAARSKGAPGTSLLAHEYDALLAGHQGHSTEVTTELLTITDVLQPLLRQYEVTLRLAESDRWFLTSIPDVAVRQIFVSLLATAVRWASGGTIDVDCDQVEDRIEIHVTLSRQTGDPPPLDPSVDFHEVTELLAFSGGELQWHQQSDRSASLTVHMPAVALLTVLAIDDNTDILQLLARYTNGTRYEVIPCSEPANALRLALDHNPAVITLDVMMAGLDGWQLVQELRQNRRTAHIPLVVCSVLAQEEIAGSLGVRAYLRKPVSREDYLRTLDCLASGKAIGSRPATQ
jgi:CheY-like chemotaxis protein